MEQLLDRMVDEVTRGRVFARLPDETQTSIGALSQEEVREGARRGMTRPQPGDVSEAGRLLLNPCLAVQWLTVFEELDLPEVLHIFEPCAGGSEPVLLAADMYARSGSYTTINLNRRLAAELRSKTRKLHIDINIIEDNAGNALSHLQPGAFDVACFHHAINDILQTSVSEPRGMDTRSIEWWSHERQMIEWLAYDFAAGRLDEYARPALLGVVRQAAELVRPQGYLLFDHWTWEAHRNMSWFPWDLFCNLIPMAREWINEAIAEENIPLHEIPLGERNPQWWMAFRRLD